MAVPPHPPQPDRTPDFDDWVDARAFALMRFAYVLTGREDEADEVVVRGLASARARWRRTRTTDGLEDRARVAAVRAYLRRGGRRRAAIEVEEPDAPLPAGAEAWWTSPGDSAGDTEPDLLSALLWERSRRLGRRERTALVLRCYEGLGIAETAATMRCRRSTARAAWEDALTLAMPGPVGIVDTRRADIQRALQEYADRAPTPYSPAPRATQCYLRQRRRRVLTGAGVAAVLLVPVAFGLAGGGTTPDAASQQSVPLVDPRPVDRTGWRWESWGGIQVQVPGTWGHGDLTQWCVTRGPDGPAVDRPEMEGTDAMCSLSDNGRSTYTGGLLLRRTEEALRLSRADVAPYATSRIHTVGDVTMTLVDIDPAVGDAILLSAQVIGRRDYNGCEPRRDLLEPSPLGGRSGTSPLAGVGRVGSVSVCRYGLTGWPQPTLISSRRLTGRPGGDLLSAVRSAPVLPRTPLPAATACAPSEEIAVLEFWPRPGSELPVSVVVRYDGCRGHGIDDGRSLRALTAEVLDPVLVAPWTGAPPTDVRPARPVR